ncbi:MAG: hypothetical protein R3257_06180, partial [bacterium]|nr:hypothetical protein [bacterium]
MRYLIAIAIILISLGTGLARLLANPFRHRYVCAPAMNHVQNSLEFYLKDGGPCGQEETWLQVETREDGTILLLPIEPPLSQEQQNDLEAYRRYYGIERQ